MYRVTQHQDSTVQKTILMAKVIMLRFACSCRWSMKTVCEISVFFKGDFILNLTHDVSDVIRLVHLKSWEKISTFFPSTTLYSSSIAMNVAQNTFSLILRLVGCGWHYVTVN